LKRQGDILPVELSSIYIYRWSVISLDLRRVAGMTKEGLVKKIQGLLKTDDDLSFLLKLRMEDLKTLVAMIRDRVDQVGC